MEVHYGSLLLLPVESFPQWKLKKKKVWEFFGKISRGSISVPGILPRRLHRVCLWAYRKLYRLPCKGGHAYSAGFMSKRHGKNQTNQAPEVKLKNDHRMTEESQRWCRASLCCWRIFLVPVPKQYLANQYLQAGTEALLQQTLWF